MTNRGVAQQSLRAGSAGPRCFGPRLLQGALGLMLVACSAADPAPAAAVSSPELGFVDLKERCYALAGEWECAARARVFYALLPAGSKGRAAPLIVVTGGGPAASALFLFAYHAPVSLSSSLAEAGEANPASLTELGNVLYLDTVNAGFSHPLLPDPSLDDQRALEFSTKNYNLYRDAGDVLGALLLLVQAHPSLFDDGVYWLTESYGAARAGVIVDFLLHPEGEAGAPARYYEPELRQGARGRSLELLASQLRGEILVEPWFAGDRQRQITGELWARPDSLIDQLGQGAGVPYQRCSEQDSACDNFQQALQLLKQIDRSPYDYRQSQTEYEDAARSVTRAANQHRALERLFTVAEPMVDAALGQPRGSAYRFADRAESLWVTRGDLDQRYGTPAPWDAYFVPLNVEAQAAFLSAETRALGADPEQSGLGSLFLQNARRLPVFVTRGQFDLMIYGPALVPVLESEPEVRSVVFAPAAPFDEIRLAFVDGTEATVLSREYPSSHSVSRDAALPLAEDMARFLELTRD